MDLGNFTFLITGQHWWPLDVQGANNNMHVNLSWLKVEERSLLVCVRGVEIMLNTPSCVCGLNCRPLIVEFVLVRNKDLHSSTLGHKSPMSVF